MVWLVGFWQASSVTVADVISVIFGSRDVLCIVSKNNTFNIHEFNYLLFYPFIRFRRGANCCRNSLSQWLQTVRIPAVPTLRMWSLKSTWRVKDHVSVRMPCFPSSWRTSAGLLVASLCTGQVAAMYYTGAQKALVKKDQTLIELKSYEGETWWKLEIIILRRLQHTVTSKIDIFSTLSVYWIHYRTSRISLVKLFQAISTRPGTVFHAVLA